MPNSRRPGWPPVIAHTILIGNLVEGFEAYGVFTHGADEGQAQAEAYARRYNGCVLAIKRPPDSLLTEVEEGTELT